MRAATVVLVVAALVVAQAADRDDPFFWRGKVLQS
jgi:hypothetical protein